MVKCQVCKKEVQFPCMHHTPEEIAAAKKKRSRLSFGAQHG